FLRALITLPGVPTTPPLPYTTLFRSGLGYEIVWTRQLSLALGTEMMAVLGAIAGFFAGLALGAFVLDSHIRRATKPHQVYAALRSEEHTSELQSRENLVCRLLLEKKN